MPCAGKDPFLAIQVKVTETSVLAAGESDNQETPKQ